MNWRLLLLLIVAVGAAFAATQYVRTWLEAQRQEAEQQQQAKPAREEVPSDRILVAAETLQTGTILKPEDVRWADWPRPQVNENYIIESEETENLEGVTGAVARQRVVAGTPLVADMYVKPGDQGFLAAILEPGKRAMSVRVNNAATLSGLVFPGDRVDVILSHTVQTAATGEADGESVEVTETVLPDMKILAMGTRTNNPDNEPQNADIATLEATPKQARQLVMAERLGQIRFSLRGIADTGPAGEAADAADPLYTLAHEVSPLMRAPRQRADDENETDSQPQSTAFTVEIVRGGQVQTRTFGGDAPPESAQE